MIQSTQGIVLQTLKYGESSLICRIYTEKFGLVSYMVNGVRSTKSIGKAVLLQAGNILDLEVYNRENKNLQHVKEYKLAHLFKHISHHIIKTSICLFTLELLNHSIQEQENNDSLYHFIINSILHLDKMDCDDVAFPVWFAIQLSKQIGYEPGNEFDNLHPFFSLKEGLFHSIPQDEYSINRTCSRYWHEVLQQEFPANIYEKNQERREMLDAVQLYFRYHIENFKPLKSPPILHQVLS